MQTARMPLSHVAPAPPAGLTEARRASHRLAVIATVFLVLSAPIVWGVTPENPAWEALARTPDRLAFAVVGDSRARVGVAPRLMTEVFERAGVPGLRAYNFAVNGTDVLHHRSFVVSGLLGAPSRPRVILWTPTPLAFDEMRTHNRLDQLRWADVVPLLRAGTPLEMVLDVATIRALPPYGHRPQIKEHLEDFTDKAGIRLAALQRVVLGLEYQKPPRGRAYTLQPDGQEPFVILADREARFQRGVEGYRARYAALRLGEWHFALARDLARRAREGGVLLVMLELPVAPYPRSPEAAGKHEAWRRAMQALAAEQGAVWMSHVDHYPDDAFFGDPGHMPAPVAEDYSRFLAGALLAEPRVRAALQAP